MISWVTLKISFYRLLYLDKCVIFFYLNNLISSLEKSFKKVDNMYGDEIRCYFSP